MAYINDDWLQYEYETMVLVKYIENNLNQINRDYFEGNLGILSVTNNSDYVTVKNRGVYIADYDTQKLSDALKDFSEEDSEFLFPYDLWDYLEHCKYTPESQKLFVELENLLDKIDTYFSHRSKLSIEQQNDKVNICKNDECLSFFIEPLVTSLNNVDIDHSFDDLWDYLKYEFQYHGVKSDNELKTDNELSFSEKRQVALVDWLLNEPVPVHKTSSLDDWTLSLIPQSPDFRLNTEASTLNELVDELEAKNEILEKKIQELEYSQTWVENLQQRVHDLECAVYLLQQENKQLKSNQTETKPEPQPEPKLTAKKRPKFKLPEDFADYQQECDDLVNALSCFYNIKKGKWGKDILQFILTPTDAEKAKHPYPNNWRAGLYLHCGYWSMDKVNLSDPDKWEDWLMDVYDFANANGIEIS